MDLLRLFLSFLRTGLCAIGGAYSFLPLLEKEIIEKYHWLTKEEFLEVLAAVRILPGAISIKYATYVGYKIAGIPGAIVANLGNLLAPAFLIIVVMGFYSKYKDMPHIARAFSMIQLAVFSMIIAVAFQLLDVRQLVQVKSLAVIVISFTLFTYTKVHPALIVVGAGVLGAFLK